MQFVLSAIQSIFATGANVSAIRDKNDNSVFSGIICGSILGFIIFASVIINIEKYINFMNNIQLEYSAIKATIHKQIANYVMLIRRDYYFGKLIESGNK